MDMNADGVLDNTAWVGPQDGVLVHDTFGDGSVRSTSQFAFARHIGESDLQGLAAQFDSNLDGVLDAQDAQFAEFAVWQDADSDGVADAGEVKHLLDLGITSLNLVSDGVSRNPATGVTEAGRSTAQLANGSTMVVADAAFDYSLCIADTTVQADDANSTEVLAPLALATADDSSVIPADSSVIPASEPGSTAADAAAAFENKPYTLSPEQMQEVQASVNEATTHIEPWFFLPESMVLDLNPASWNKPYTLSTEQLSDLGLPVSADVSLASLASLAMQLNLNDVLLSLAEGVTQFALQVNGSPVTGDTLNLDNLLGPDAAPTQLTATGTVQQDGQSYTYHVDTTLQAMLDQQQMATS
jgi:hypothetical protein